MQRNEYDSINLLYNFDTESEEEVMQVLAAQLRSRRLERGLSREALAQMSGVPVATIAKFEQKASLSLRQYAALCKALGYKEKLKQVMDAPIYHTMEELEIIRRNQHRKHGSNQFNQ